MNTTTRQWAIESILSVSYFMILTFAFLPVYLNTYSYLLGSNYDFDLSKFCIALFTILITNVFLLILSSKTNAVYLFALRLFYVLSFVPMLALYSCGSLVKTSLIMEPVLFGIILMFCLQYYSANSSEETRINVEFYPFENVDYYVLIACGIISVITWALTGFPVLSSFGEGYEQRMLLRQNGLPTVLNYLYTMIGGVILPYLFARNFVKKYYWRMVASGVFGMLLFFVNGMKTWLFLYVFAIVIVLGVKTIKSGHKFFIITEASMILISCLIIFLTLEMGKLGPLSQFGRVIIIPNNIGFKFVNFFQSNELLYLRESILRSFFPSPYPNGSDFYINYGLNSTVTSSRANNGLFGDAYRNFGLIGVAIYPILTAKVLNIIERNCRKEDLSIRFFVMFILVWEAINTSFFTWLLTGGVILLLILLKTYDANSKKLEITDLSI